MLKRDIGKWGIILLMLNNVVGAGIYGLPSKLFDLTNIYSLAILGFLLGLFLLYASEYSDFKDFIIFTSIGLVLYLIFSFLKNKK